MSRKSIPSGNMDHRGQVGGGQGVKERTNMSCTHVSCHRLQTYACIAKTHFSPVISCAVFQSHLTLQSNSHITISGIYTQNQTFVLDVVLWHISYFTYQALVFAFVSEYISGNGRDRLSQDFRHFVLPDASHAHTVIVSLFNLFFKSFVSLSVFQKVTFYLHFIVFK